MRSTLLATFSIFFICHAQAQDAVESFIHFPLLKVKPLPVPVFKGPHSQCHSVGGHLTGKNIHSPVRLASVSKLVTSYWALRKLGPDFRFITTIGYNKTLKTLYINSNGDPFFGRRKIFLLISELNKMGITSLDKIELHKDSVFLPSVEQRSSRFTEYGVSGGPSQAFISAKLMKLVNTAQWDANLKADYKRFNQVATENKIPVRNQVRLNVKSVDWTSQQRPMSWTMSSVPLIQYLKALNQFSMNYIGDRLFFILGGKPALEKFLAREPELNRDSYEFYTGSGLNIGQGVSRVDNAASCFFIITLLEKISDLLKQNGLSKHQLFFVIGSEQGTLNPGPNSPWAGRLLAKTGTLRNAVTLAGFMRTDKGEVPFGLFYQTQNKRLARMARNRQIDKWFDELGFAKPLNYNATTFFPIPRKGYLQRY